MYFSMHRQSGVQSKIQWLGLTNLIAKSFLHAHIEIVVAFLIFNFSFLVMTQHHYVGFEDICRNPSYQPPGPFWTVQDLRKPQDTTILEANFLRTPVKLQRLLTLFCLCGGCSGGCLGAFGRYFGRFLGINNLEKYRNKYLRIHSATFKIMKKALNFLT